MSVVEEKNINLYGNTECLLMSSESFYCEVIFEEKLAFIKEEIK